MISTDYRPVTLDLEAELAEAYKRPGFKEAYDALKDEYNSLRTFLDARKKAGLTRADMPRQ
ncbi:MAG: hypothetical protein H7833_14195 [Magnetococcus sp. DMHC-1]